MKFFSQRITDGWYMDTYFMTCKNILFYKPLKLSLFPQINQGQHEFSTVWTWMNYAEPFWTMLNHIEPCWTMLNHGEPFWTMLNHAEPYWTMLNHTEPCWTILNPTESDWTWLHLKTVQKLYFPKQLLSCKYRQRLYYFNFEWKYI